MKYASLPVPLFVKDPTSTLGDTSSSLRLEGKGVVKPRREAKADQLNQVDRPVYIYNTHYASLSPHKLTALNNHLRPVSKWTSKQGSENRKVSQLANQ